MDYKEINSNLSLEDMPGEIWKPVRDYENLYEVSNLGRVKSLDKWVTRRNSNKQTFMPQMIRKLVLNIDGYLMIGLRKDGKIKGYGVHRLVANAHIKNINNYPVIHHRDSIKSHNTISNLVWVTYSENTKDAYKNGRIDQSHARSKQKSKKHTLQLPENYFSLESFPGEIWKDIPGWEGQYQASTLGRIKSLTRIVNLKTGQKRNAFIRKPGLMENGYLTVTLCKNNKTSTHLIHRLVAFTYLPKPENKSCINHIDLNRQCNNINNLEWTTQAENIHHSINRGSYLNNINENNNMAKLKNKDIPIIREKIINGISCRKLANEYDVSDSTIFRIKHGQSWKNIQ